MKRLLGLFLLILLQGSAWATTRYVATNGDDDANTCAESTNIATPKRNLNGANGALACMTAGDTLIIRAGTYNESIAGSAVPSGIDASTPTVIMGAVGETAILQPLSSGACATSGADVVTVGATGAARHHITYKNLTLDANGFCQTAITLRGSTFTVPNNIVLDELVTKNSTIYCIHSQLGPSDSYSTNVTVKNSTVGPCGETGIYLQSHGQVLIEGNTVFGCDGPSSDNAIRVRSDATPSVGSTAVVRNNTVFDNNRGINLAWPKALAYNNLVYSNNEGPTGQYGVYTSENGEETGIFNNTIVGSGSDCIRLISTTAGSTVQGNICWQNGNNAVNDLGTGNLVSGNIFADPLFVNQGANDYHLQAGSPAIGVGTVLSDIFTTDFEGTVRTIPWEAGAYDKVGTTRYISTTGDDTNNTCAESTNIATPKRNFKGTNGAINCMSQGDVLIVRGGTYTTETDIGLSAPGQWRSGTYIKGADGETVIIRPASGTGVMFVYSRSFITFEGITFDGANTSGNTVYTGRNTTADTPSSDITYRRIQVLNGGSPGNGSSGIGLGFRQDTVTTPCNMKLLDSFISNNGADGHGHGLYGSCRYQVIDGNEFSLNAGHGIHIYAHGVESGGNAWTGNSGTIVRNNIVHHNHEVGIGLYNGIGIKAYNNVVYANGDGLPPGQDPGKAFAIRYACVNCEVYNNTLYGNVGTGGIYSDSTNATNPTTGTIVRNNIIFNQTGSDLTNAVSGAINSNNLCGESGNPICSQTTQTAAQLFTNVAANNFVPIVGSALIGTGADLSNVFTTDYDGNVRSVPWDIGAYEFVDIAESLTLIEPNGGELWEKAVQHTIQWSSANITNVRLRADRGNDGTFEETISASTPSDGTFNWTPGGTASATVKIEVCDAADFSPCAVSANVFSITDAAGGSLTKIISENTSGSFIGDIGGVDDVAIWSDQPTTNFGSSSLNANKTATITNHFLLRFAGLSQIPSNALVSSATLGIHLRAQSGGGTGTFDFRQLLRPWVEPEATYNSFSTSNNWTTAGATGAGTDRNSTTLAQFVNVGTTLQFYTITDSGSGGLKDLVQDWIDGSASNNGLHSERNGAGADGRLWTWTNSESDDGNRPFLSVTYTLGASSITVTEPFAAHYAPGQMVPVRWQSSGVSGGLTILLSRDGGLNFNEVLATDHPVIGPDFVWTVTKGVGNSCIIKIVSNNDSTVFGMSAPFRVAGSIVRIR